MKQSYCCVKCVRSGRLVHSEKYFHIWGFWQLAFNGLYQLFFIRVNLFKLITCQIDWWRFLTVRWWSKYIQQCKYRLANKASNIIKYVFHIQIAWYNLFLLSDFMKLIHSLILRWVCLRFWGLKHLFGHQNKVSRVIVRGNKGFVFFVLCLAAWCHPPTNMNWIWLHAGHWLCWRIVTCYM